MPTTTSYDLIVLGTGGAGSKVANACREAGWRVAIADGRPFGGTCALRGCEPKKALWTLADALDRSRRLADVGLEGGGTNRIDWPALMAFKRSFTDPVPGEKAAAFARAGIDALHGAARFVGRDEVAVADRRLRARHVLVATGDRPAAPPVEGADLLATSDDFLELESLPERLVLVGGGYISFEIAHIAARAGARPTIVHADERPLGRFDRDLVRRLVEHSRSVGIAVELGAEVEAIERRGDGVVVRARDGRSFEGGIAVHGLGRVPNLDGLDLEAGGIETDEGGRLRLDGHLRSVSNPAVYAAGDAAARGPALTPVATHDAECVAANLLRGCRHEPDYEGVASAVFAIPPLAMVGLTEEEARGKGLEVEVRAGDMAGFATVRREREPAAAYKVVLARDGGRVLGAHLLGPGAEEVVNLFALAVRLGLAAADLRRLLSAYPSGGSNIANMLG